MDELSVKRGRENTHTHTHIYTHTRTHNSIIVSNIIRQMTNTASWDRIWFSAWKLMNYLQKENKVITIFQMTTARWNRISMSHVALSTSHPLLCDFNFPHVLHVQGEMYACNLKLRWFFFSWPFSCSVLQYQKYGYLHFCQSLSACMPLVSVYIACLFEFLQWSDCLQPLNKSIKNDSLPSVIFTKVTCIHRHFFFIWARRSLYSLFRNVNPEKIFDCLREMGMFCKV